ncbi:hypothetical protein GW17_00045342 [Ensete ventricosum]|nr:hypothetical protein GW17_00045342 [Ensete ventricosum]
MKTTFVEAMEDAIAKHLDMIFKISDIKFVSGKEENNFEGVDEDDCRNKSNTVEENVDGGDEDDESLDDQGTDFKRRKQQANDEVEYDDGIEKENILLQQVNMMKKCNQNLKVKLIMLKQMRIILWEGEVPDPKPQVTGTWILKSVCFGITLRRILEPAPLLAARRSLLATSRHVRIVPPGTYRYVDRPLPGGTAKIDRRRSISAVDGRLKEKSTVGGQLRKKGKRKKKKRKRRKNKRRRRRKKKRKSTSPASRRRLRVTFLPARGERSRRLDSYASQQSRSATSYNEGVRFTGRCLSMVLTFPERAEDKDAECEPSNSKVDDDGESSPEEFMFKEVICGEEALKISSVEPYCLSHPIRRGHFNVSQHYPLHQINLEVI